MPFDLEQAAMKTKPPEKPAYSAAGYIIARDGTTYALVYAYYHGIVMALLHPDKLEQYDPKESIPFWNEEKDDYDYLDRLKIHPNREENNVFKFQRFAFWFEREKECDLVRIATGRMHSQFCLDKPWMGCSPEQIEAIRLVVKEHDMGPRDTVIADHANIKVKDLWDWLPVGGEFIPRTYED